MGVWRGGGDWWFVRVRRQWRGSGFLLWLLCFFFFCLVEEGGIDGLGFIFFLVLTVDYRLLVVVVVVSSVCSAAMVVKDGNPSPTRRYPAQLDPNGSGFI